MPMLSPILLPNEKKNERHTKGLRGFYLVETSSGLKGIVGAIDPKALKRVQEPGSESARRLKTAGKLFHAVYWNGRGAPELELEGTEVRGGYWRISRVAEKSAPALTDFFSEQGAFLVGAERFLDEAVAAEENSVPVALWNAGDPELPWLPCHRVLRDVDWYQSGWMVCLGREHMFFQDVTSRVLSTSEPVLSLQAGVIETLLATRDEESMSLLAVSKDGAWRIHSKSGWADGILEHLHPSLREIAVVQLLSILLPKGLSLAPNDGSQEDQVTVVHDSEEAIAALNEGAQVAYLLSPIRSEKLRELVQHGQMLPAESVALKVAALEGWMDAE
jgi:hypothetical protein